MTVTGNLGATLGRARVGDHERWSPVKPWEAVHLSMYWMYGGLYCLRLDNGEEPGVSLDYAPLAAILQERRERDRLTVGFDNIKAETHV